MSRFTPCVNHVVVCVNIKYCRTAFKTYIIYNNRTIGILSYLTKNDDYITRTSVTRDFPNVQAFFGYKNNKTMGMYYL